MNITKRFDIAVIFLSFIVPLLATRIIECQRCGREHLLRSPAIGIDINTESLTCAIKYADGTLAQLAKIAASHELRTLLQEWAKDPIAVFPESDPFENEPLDGDPLTPEADVLYKPLEALIDQSSAQLPTLDLHHQHYAISLPPFVHHRHFRHARQAARKARLMTTETGSIGHSDRTTHMVYNALFCIYHVHPHDPLCSTGELVDGVFDALAIDYSPSWLTVTWLETYSPFSMRKGGFADRELGGRLRRDHQYWAAVEERFAAIVHSVKREHSQDDYESPLSASVPHNQLIFLGELGMDVTLRKFLRDAFVGTRFDFNIVAIHDSFSPVFASAFSAAIAEKGVMDAPKPENCFESHECKDLRERVYEEALRGGPRDEL